MNEKGKRMTLKEAEARIAALEAQVAMLAGQLAAQSTPVVVPYPVYPTPSYPRYPSNPWWYSTSGIATATNTTGATVTYLTYRNDGEPPEPVGAKPA